MIPDWFPKKLELHSTRQSRGKTRRSKVCTYFQGAENNALKPGRESAMCSMVNANLAELRSLLLKGIRESKQSSYGRRAPAASAVPILAAARAGLREFVENSGLSAEAWRLLSQVEECLLNYSEARICL